MKRKPVVKEALMSAWNIFHEIALLREQTRIAIKRSRKAIDESNEVIRTSRELCRIPPMPEPGDLDGE